MPADTINYPPPPCQPTSTIATYPSAPSSSVITYPVGPYDYNGDIPHWNDMSNQEKFDFLHTLIKGLDSDIIKYTGRIRELEDLLAEHRHTSDGHLMVEYKRKY